MLSIFIWPYGVLIQLVKPVEKVHFPALLFLQTGQENDLRRCSCKYQKGWESPGEGRNKTEIVPFHLQGDITSFQLYCLSTHFWRSLLGQSAGHKRDEAVSRHSLLFGISGTQNCCASLSCYGISPKAVLPCPSCSQAAAKWFQNRSHSSWKQPHSFLFKGRLL